LLFHSRLHVDLRDFHDHWRAPDCCDCAAASPALRRQDEQRQSSVESPGSGRRTGTDAHQHSPDRPQLKSVPQRAQTTRRPRGIEVWDVDAVTPTV